MRAPVRIGLYLLVVFGVLFIRKLWIVAFVLIFFVFLGGINPSLKMKKTFVMSIFLCGGIFIGNLFWSTGKVLLEIAGVTITDSALQIATERALKVAVLVFSAKVLFANKPHLIAQELRWIMLPFNKIGLHTEVFVSSIEETLYALPEVQQRIFTKASQMNRNGTSKLKALGMAIYETFIQELRHQ